MNGNFVTLALLVKNITTYIAGHLPIRKMCWYQTYSVCATFSDLTTSPGQPLHHDTEASYCRGATASSNHPVSSTNKGVEGGVTEAMQDPSTSLRCVISMIIHAPRVGKLLQHTKVLLSEALII